MQIDSELVEDKTTIASWLLVICKTLTQLDIKQEILTDALGIDLPSIYKNPNQRIEISTMTAVWRLIADISQRPDIGFLVAKNLQPQHFRGLGFSLLASESINQFFVRIAKYSDLISNSVIVYLEKNKGKTALCLDVKPNTEITDEAMDAFMLVIHIFIKQLFDTEQINPVIEFASGERQLKNHYEVYFNTTITFDCNTYKYWLDNRILDKHLSLGDVQLATKNDQLVEDYLFQISSKSNEDWIKKVNRHIQQLIKEQNLSSVHLSSALNISERSLRRKLQRSGFSYQTLVDKYKKQLCIQWLNNSQYKITEISYLLGYKDTSNFSRAFKRWFGCSPRVYSQQLLKSQ